MTELLAFGLGLLVAFLYLRFRSKDDTEAKLNEMTALAELERFKPIGPARQVYYEFPYFGEVRVELDPNDPARVRPGDTVYHKE